ncbi:aminoacyl-tRNA hydrolase [bacterium]|uniref:Peptidyl-tRNA hydrolase n=1 Tax=Rubinisphaera brasiliensis (strain ATCC 49424 / DSM 5305 / JCM 21570 / IAM 15109 / NBRC 103401 / IFAM 1448) TaxID=756272 RepID=F0SN43_RUBBR|nr:aminoacyl-tRNA hydrolase [Rubinisphaera brasiliensis]ADY61072.1 peptidyl-tRNA hydrolase [Rubinisphaera brasiliensis DSM 5305]MBR9803097.1 aminoacyl-tRNA hydrolase [bacterium]
MKVIVGLGNPGGKYEGTRHNVGFEVLYELARKWQASGVTRAHEAEIAEVHVAGEKTLLVAPQTFMNLSGRSVGSLVKFYKVDLEDLLVISDDLNLPCGQLRLRASGSSGGQKGIRDIIAHLGTEDFPRLRVGIGRPPGRMDVSTFVLKRFLAEERETMDLTVRDAVDAVELWLREGVTAAMNKVNTKSPDKA